MQTEPTNTRPDGQLFNRRRDWHTRSIVQTGIELGKTDGVGPAAVFLRSKRIPLSIALRVLFGTRAQTLELDDAVPAPCRQRATADNAIIDADS